MCAYLCSLKNEETLLCRFSRANYIINLKNIPAKASEKSIKDNYKFVYVI
jgi:hypothetical protein